MQDILYYILTLGFIVLVGFISYASYRLAQALMSLKKLIEDLEETTKDVNLIKNKVKGIALSSLALLLRGILKKRR